MRFKVEDKTDYVGQLPEHIQAEIKKDITKSLLGMDLERVEETFEEVLRNGMNSRLCDLEDTIDITKYL